MTGDEAYATGWRAFEAGVPREVWLRTGENAAEQCAWLDGWDDAASEESLRLASGEHG